MKIETAKDLEVYKFAYELAMEIFELTKHFPPEEKYALTSQIRRSSEAHFVSKLSDCDGENSETDSSLDFACSCGYISKGQHEQLTARCAEIGRMLGGMMKKAESFLTSQS